MEKQGGRVDTPVFAIAAGISVVFVLVGVVFQDDLATVVGDVLSWVLENLGWLFVLSTAGFLIFVGFLAVTPYGRLRLGKDDDRPEFKTASRPGCGSGRRRSRAGGRRTAAGRTAR
jgi:glycine betaine transporter